MKTHSHILFWLAVIFIALFIVPIGLAPETVRARVFNEQQASVIIFGVATTNAMTRRANTFYDIVVNDTGIGSFMDKFYTTNSQVSAVPISQDTQRNMGGAVNRYLWSVTTLLFGVCFRLNIMLQWLMYLAVFLLAAIIDGTTQRKIKFETVNALSPVKYSLALHAIIAMVFLPIFYMVIPAHISPWFMPFWALVSAWPLAKALGNASGLD